MSNLRYLEVDSYYRDRNQWPNPAEFEIPISQKGQEVKTTMVDPVSNSAAITTWRGSAFDALVPGVTVTTAVVSTTSDPKCFHVSAPNGELQQLENYYQKAVANNTTLSELRRIASYRFLGSLNAVGEHAEICVESQFGNTFAVGDVITITDPTTIAAPLTGPDIFVPAGRESNNGYPNHVLFNETVGDSRPITNYSYDTHILTLDTSAAAGGAVAGWAATDIFTIRKANPVNRGVAGASTTTTVTLPAGASAVDDFYNGDWLEVATTAYPFVAPDGQTRRIIDYTGATRVATVFPAFTVAPTGGVDVVAVLPTTRDNAVPFNYTGSLVSQSETVCYEIELLNLVLPNKTLNVGQGGRIAFYPYVYVELKNVSSSGGAGPGIIYSNNPNAKRMLFRAAVDDTPTPLISPFIKIDGDGMIQTIKFKPNDNLKFSVHMPDGSLFELEDSDTTGPVEPNGLYQISAVFSMRRL